MAVKLTPKQEKFVQVYIETGNASEAYRNAYNAENMKPTTIVVKASELLAKGNVAVRVANLKAHHAKRHDVTVDSLTSELDEIRQAAVASEQWAPAVSAVMGKAKIHGFDKQIVTGPDGGAIPHSLTVTFKSPR